MIAKESTLFDIILCKIYQLLVHHNWYNASEHVLAHHLMQESTCAYAHVCVCLVHACVCIFVCVCSCMYACVCVYKYVCDMCVSQYVPTDEMICEDFPLLRLPSASAYTDWNVERGCSSSFVWSSIKFSITRLQCISNKCVSCQQMRNDQLHFLMTDGISCKRKSSKFNENRALSIATASTILPLCRQKVPALGNFKRKLITFLFMIIYDVLQAPLQNNFVCRSLYKSKFIKYNQISFNIYKAWRCNFNLPLRSIFTHCKASKQLRY